MIMWRTAPCAEGEPFPRARRRMPAGPTTAILLQSAPWPYAVVVATGLAFFCASRVLQRYPSLLHPKKKSTWLASTTDSCDCFCPVFLPPFAERVAPTVSASMVILRHDARGMPGFINHPKSTPQQMTIGASKPCISPTGDAAWTVRCVGVGACSCVCSCDTGQAKHPDEP